MGEAGNRKYGLLQDLLLIVVSVSCAHSRLNPASADTGNMPLTFAKLLQSFSMYYIAKSVVSSLPLANDPEREQHEQARVKATANLRRLDRLRDDEDSDGDSGRGTGRTRRPRKEDFELDQYESQIAMEVVAPEDIPVGFDGGLAHNDTWLSGANDL